MSEIKFPEGVRVLTSLTIDPAAAVSGLTRSDLDEESLSAFLIPWTSWTVWDAIATNLPGTAAGDDLELIGNTFGTGSPTIETGDVKTLTGTRYARCQVALPMNYNAGSDVVVRFHAGMKTTIADTSCTLDLEAYKSDEEAGIGPDLCSTAATTINSLTLSDVTFTITAGGLSPGELLDMRIAIAYTDAVSGTAVIGQIGAAKLLCDTKG